MRTYKLTISYDGSRYQGWQRQATTDNTIQYILEWSIGKLVGYRVHIDGSGRTDAGVHARGQVASVKLSKLYDTKELKDSLNRYLPEDIRIVKVELAKNGFHARKSAKGKKYEYYIDCREKPDVSSELATYKKAEEQKGLFTREKLKKEAKRISREDELSRELRKAKAFISACGLSSDFQQYKYNSTTRKNVLE